MEVTQEVVSDRDNPGALERPSSANNDHIASPFVECRPPSSTTQTAPQQPSPSSSCSVGALPRLLRARAVGPVLAAVGAGCFVWRGIDVALFRGAHKCARPVLRFLRSIQLQQYAAAICGRGFDRLDDLLHVTDQELLDDIGIQLLAHRKRIIYSADSVRRARLASSLLGWALFAALLALLLAFVVFAATNRAVREKTAIVVAVAASEVWYGLSRWRRGGSTPPFDARGGGADGLGRAASARAAARHGTGGGCGFGESFSLTDDCPSLHATSGSCATMHLSLHGADSPQDGGSPRESASASGGKATGARRFQRLMHRLSTRSLSPQRALPASESGRHQMLRPPPPVSIGATANAVCGVTRPLRRVASDGAFVAPPPSTSTSSLSSSSSAVSPRSLPDPPPSPPASLGGQSPPRDAGIGRAAAPPLRCSARNARRPPPLASLDLNAVLEEEDAPCGSAGSGQLEAKQPPGRVKLLALYVKGRCRRLVNL